MKITLAFPLRTIYLNWLDPSDEPECYDVDVVITYDNTQHDGQTVISLDSVNKKHPCNGNLSAPADYKRYHELIALNVLVIILCSTSFALLCFRSLYKAQKLRQETVGFFNANFGRELPLPTSSISLTAGLC